MRVQMTREMFASLDADALSKACMEPTVRNVRGKDFAVKSQELAKLNEAQRAVFLFRAFYDHTQPGALELFSWATMVMTRPEFWAGVKRSVLFFGDEELHAVLEELEGLVEQQGHAGKDWSEIAYALHDLDPAGDLFTSVQQTDAKFRACTPHTLERIAAYIRANPDRFVETT